MPPSFNGGFKVKTDTIFQELRTFKASLKVKKQKV